MSFCSSSNSGFTYHLGQFISKGNSDGISSACNGGHLHWNYQEAGLGNVSLPFGIFSLSSLQANTLAVQVYAALHTGSLGYSAQTSVDFCIVETQFRETSSLDMDPTTLTSFPLVLGWTGFFMTDVATHDLYVTNLA